MPEPLEESTSLANISTMKDMVSFHLPFKRIALLQSKLIHPNTFKFIILKQKSTQAIKRLTTLLLQRSIQTNILLTWWLDIELEFNTLIKILWSECKSWLQETSLSAQDFQVPQLWWSALLWHLTMPINKTEKDRPLNLLKSASKDKDLAVLLVEGWINRFL